MTTSLDVLSYLKSSYSTWGRMHRQKILYYAQAWHLAWFGKPLFDDAITAFENGPVARKAWRADVNSTVVPIDAKELSDQKRSVVDAIWDFYGAMNGTQLSILTHSEAPWKNNYESVDDSRKGKQVIPVQEIREFFSLKSINGETTPERPAAGTETVSDSDLDLFLSEESPRWANAMEILATR